MNSCSHMYLHPLQKVFPLKYALLPLVLDPQQVLQVITRSDYKKVTQCASNTLFCMQWVLAFLIMSNVYTWGLQLAGGCHLKLLWSLVYTG